MINSRNASLGVAIASPISNCRRAVSEWRNPALFYASPGPNGWARFHPFYVFNEFWLGGRCRISVARNPAGKCYFCIDSMYFTKLAMRSFAREELLGSKDRKIGPQVGISLDPWAGMTSAPSTTRDTLPAGNLPAFI